jgi:hypothetical protein
LQAEQFTTEEEHVMMHIARKFTITNSELSRSDAELEYKLRTAAAVKYAASIPPDELEDPRDCGDHPILEEVIIREIVRAVTAEPGGVFSMRLEQLCGLLHRIAVPADISDAARSGSEELRHALKIC